MNKLIIIGNGFDLAHGLNTRYSDFLVWYLRQAIERTSLNMQHEDPLIHIEGRWGNKANFSNLKDFDYFVKEAVGLRINYKSDYFKDLVNNSTKNNWVDIESDYYSRLISIYEGFIKGQLIAREPTLIALEKFHFHFSAIKEKLIEYLNTIKISPDFFNEEISSALENIIYSPHSVISDENEGDHILLLNFNYTSTLKLYSRELRPDMKKEIIHIHGSLNDPINPIIFGYGDEMDPYYEKIENLNNNEFLKNIKSFGYFKTDNYQKFLRFIDSSKYKVYILGHSCGISDRILLNNIFEHDNCQAIKIFYHQRGKNDTDFFEKTQEISRHFRPLKKSLMRKLIVPFPDCSPLTPYVPNK